MKIPKMYPFLIMLILFVPLYAQQRLKLGLINNTKQTLAYFAFAVHNLDNLEKLIRFYGYEIIAPSQTEAVGWDFFPAQKEKIHYFSAIAKVEKEKITAWAIPKRSPTVILPVPCYNQGKTILSHNQSLRIRDILYLTGSQSLGWKEKISRYWLSQNFVPLEVPFVSLHSQDDNSDFVVFEKSSGELVFEIQKHIEK